MLLVELVPHSLALLSHCSPTASPSKSHGGSENENDDTGHSLSSTSIKQMPQLAPACRTRRTALSRAANTARARRETQALEDAREMRLHAITLDCGQAKRYALAEACPLLARAYVPASQLEQSGDRGGGGGGGDDGDGGGAGGDGSDGGVT